jgi:hypothetical protein
MHHKALQVIKHCRIIRLLRTFWQSYLIASCRVIITTGRAREGGGSGRGEGEEGDVRGRGGGSEREGGGGEGREMEGDVWRGGGRGGGRWEGRGDGRGDGRGREMGGGGRFEAGLKIPISS